MVHEIWGKSGYLLCHSMKLMMMMTVIVLDVCHSACVVSLSRPARSAAFRSLSCQSLVKGLKKKRDSDTDSMNLTFWIGASMLQNEKKKKKTVDFILQTRASLATPYTAASNSRSPFFLVHFCKSQTIAVIWPRCIKRPLEKMISSADSF